MSDPRFTMEGELSQEAIDALASLLADMPDDDLCELCHARPRKEYSPTPWGERHLCSICLDALPADYQPENPMP